MATIPSYQQSVKPQPMPDVKMQQTATAESMGAGVFKGVSNAVAGYSEYQDKQDTADTISAINELKSRTNDLLYNPDTGLMLKQGANAKGAGETFKSEFDNQYKDISSQLNERQKSAFDQNVTQYRNTLQPHIDEHIVKQTEIALKDSFDNAVYTTAKILPNVWQDKNMVESSLADLDRQTRAANYQKDPETVKRLMSTSRDKVLKAAVNTLYEKQDIDGVRNFISMYGDKMTPETVAPYQGWIEKKDIKVKAQGISDSLIAEFGPDGEEAAANKLKEKYGNDPDFDIYKRTFEADMTDQRRYKKERKEQYENSMIEQIFAADSQASAQSLLDNSNLDPKTRLWLQNSYIKPKFKALAEKPTPEQKWASKYESNPSGMTKDLQVMQEYYALTTGDDAKELTPQQQTKYNMASIRLGKYQSFHGAGGYESQQEPSNMGELKQSENTDTAQQDSIDKWIDKARNAGADSEWIKQKLAEKGYDQHVSHVW